MIIGIGLTTFFVVVIAYYMIRGHRLQNNADLSSIEISVTVCLKHVIYRKL